MSIATRLDRINAWRASELRRVRRAARKAAAGLRRQVRQRPLTSLAYAALPLLALIAVSAGTGSVGRLEAPRAMAAIDPAEPSKPLRPRPGGEDADRRPSSIPVDPLETLEALVTDLCRAAPDEISVEADAFVVHLPFDAAAGQCLDDVAFRFDQEHGAARPVTFEIGAGVSEPDRPVAHVRAIHLGALPYLHLQHGEILFVGAVIDGWELIAIDERGAEFQRENRTFLLETATVDGSP